MSEELKLFPQIYLCPPINPAISPKQMKNGEKEENEREEEDEDDVSGGEGTC
jgi:hypothetical protein